MKNNFSFKVVKNNDQSRLGKIVTPRGEIDTPAFMPVGTLGTVKGIYPDDIKKNWNSNNFSKYLSFVFKTW